jgi:hypothetical protein
MRHNWTPQRIAVILLVLLALPGALVAQETDEEELFVPSYSLGDQTLEINLGMQIPLFFFGGPNGVQPTNLTIGGLGSLAWGSYITNEFKLGIEVGGSFAFTPNSRALFVIPIVADAQYIFSAYPFEFPISIGVGTSIARLDDLVKVDPFLKTGGAFYWNYSSQWAFGANLKYWFIPQIYTDNSPAGSEATRFGNFLEFSLSALYHF